MAGIPARCKIHLQRMRERFSAAWLAAMTKTRRKPRPLLRCIQSAALAMLVLALILTYLFLRPLHIPESEIYTLEPGNNALDLAREMVNNGVIAHTAPMVLAARLGNYDRDLKAGEYQFMPHFSILDVLDHVVKGVSVPKPIRFIEGWTFRDYLAELLTKPNLEQTLSGVPYDEIMQALGIPQSHPEGWFFPDTYFYVAGQSDADILKSAYDAMHRRLHEQWDNRASGLPYETPYEALIAASIIEKETGVPSEYPIIGGVIVNRLRKGMRLQMDPTVIYGLDDFDGTLLRAELDADTPYNTYTRHGLPPTPIAMPGLMAIRAATQPAETEALYFVARGDGTHRFSRTLDEHIKAVREYRQRSQ